MADLTPDEIDEIRTSYIRDKYTASPLVALSNYNRANKANFIDDSALELLHDRLRTDFAEELKGVYDSKYHERISFGDSTSVATTEATAQKKHALFRLIRAEVRLMMMEDPGFRSSFSDKETRDEIFKAWERAIQRDRTFTRSRSSAALGAVPLVRY